MNISRFAIIAGWTGLFIGLAAHAGTLAGQEFTCTVESITDGDTFRCDDERVRLLTIDAPEKEQGPFSNAAQEALARLLPVGSEVRLALDVEKRDQYDRLLAYVYLTDDRMVNALMARQGFAVLDAIWTRTRNLGVWNRLASMAVTRCCIGWWAVRDLNPRPPACENRTHNA